MKSINSNKKIYDISSSYYHEIEEIFNSYQPVKLSKEAFQFVSISLSLKSFKSFKKFRYKKNERKYKYNNLSIRAKLSASFLHTLNIEPGVNVIDTANRILKRKKYSKDKRIALSIINSRNKEYLKNNNIKWEKGDNLGKLVLNHKSLLKSKKGKSSKPQGRFSIIEEWRDKTH